MELKRGPETRFWLIFAVLSIASAMLVIHIASTPEERARAGGSSQLRADYSRDPIVPDDQLIVPIDPAVIGDTARDLGVSVIETVVLLPSPPATHSEQTAAVPSTPTLPTILPAPTVVRRTPTSATTGLPTATQVLVPPDEAIPTEDEGTPSTPGSGDTPATVVSSITADVASSPTLVPATATPTSTPAATETATTTPAATATPTATATATATPTATATATLTATAPAIATTRLKNIPITGALIDSGTFDGKVTITSFEYDSINGLTVSGILKGTATTVDGAKQHIDQSFDDVHATLNETASGSASPTLSCQILFLDIRPIFLDPLGLQLDPSEIALDLTAVTDAGNLLGNLLCAVAGLLDTGGFLTGPLSELTALLEAINAIIR